MIKIFKLCQTILHHCEVKDEIAKTGVNDVVNDEVSSGKGALFLCIYVLNSHLKCSYKSALVKTHQNFFLRGSYVAHERFIEVSLFQGISLVPKISWFRCLDY